MVRHRALGHVRRGLPSRRRRPRGLARVRHASSGTPRPAAAAGSMERVERYEPRAGQTVAVEDEQISGHAGGDVRRPRGRRVADHARARLRAQGPRRSGRCRPSSTRCSSAARQRESLSRCAGRGSRGSWRRGAGAGDLIESCRHVRLQSRRRRRRDHGRADRPDHRRRRDRRRPQGRQAGARRRRASTEARNVTEGQIARLVKKGKLTDEQAAAAGRRGRRPHHTAPRPTTGSATSTSSSRPSPSAWRSSRPSSPSSTRSRPATRSSPPTPRRCRSPRSATRRCGPTRSSASTTSTRPSVMPLIEIIEGDDTSARDGRRPRELRPGDQEAADHLRRGPRLRRQPDPELRHRRDLARAGGARPVDQGDRRGRRRRERRADGRRSSSSTCSASTPSCTSPSTSTTSYGDRFYVHEGMRRARRRRASSAPRRAAAGFYKRRRAAGPGRRADADGEELAELMALKSFVEACLVLEEGVARTATSTSG